MPALEILTGFVTAPGATITTLGMAAGNSATVRNTELDSKILLLQAWTDNQVAGILRIRSPRLHDNVQNIRLGAAASEVYPLLPYYSSQTLIAQDTLALELSGSAVAGQIETACFLIYYANLPGINARFISPEDLTSRIVNLVSVENTLSLGIAGGYSGEEAINAEFDLLKANTDYALLGYLCSAECACIRWRGIDTGNLGIGGPGNEANKIVTQDFFVDLSYATGLPLIPIFNSANKAGILIDGAQDQTGTDVTIQSVFAELKP